MVAWLSVALFSVLPIFAGSGFTISPDAPLVAAWMVALFYLYQAAVGGHARAWYAMGVAVGLGMLSKYTIVLLAPTALLVVLLDPPARMWLRRREPYLGGLIALALFSPVLYWNATHDWASFAFQGPRRFEMRTAFAVHRYLLDLVVLMTPSGIAATCLALWGVRAIDAFDQVAKSASDDKSVLINSGNLGYFTVFQMITPFEEAAYNLRPETLSMPVRTAYGYHIIKVTDKRPSKGKIRVAHIMKAAPPGSDEETVKKAQTEINNLYSRLKNGESFRKLATEYSDHKESAAVGGEVNSFGAGEIISDFSEAAFSIKDTGEYIKPVRSVYGFHIIKLLDRKGPGSYEESKSYLESKLNQSNLISIGKKSFINNLKKEYGFKINPAVYEWFVKKTDTLIIKGISKYDL